MCKRPFIYLATLLALSCDGDESNSSEQDVIVSGSNRCEDGELEPGISSEPLLSEMAYQVMLSSGLFVREANVLTVSYHQGYNLNFEITEEQALSLLPCNLTPMRLKLLESDSEPLYYLSWYMAGMDSTESDSAMTRIDLFTYAWDQNGKPSLYFISSYMGLPAAFRENPQIFEIFEEIFEFFARDSRTGEPAYPHYYADTLTVTQDGFNLVYENSSIELTSCETLSTAERFSRDFVLVNSQIYRTPLDKNVNFFNQSFINVPVETRDPACVRFENLAGFHPLLSNLRSIHFYGSATEKITWYYQMCSGDDCGNPFE